LSTKEKDFFAMEAMLATVMVQATCLPEGIRGTACLYWDWAFWVGFFLGLVGAIVGFFMKPESMK
jgi:hypothetical protein